MRQCMKAKVKAVFGLPVLVTLALIGMACPADNDNGGRHNFATPLKYREMASFTGATVSGSTSSSINGTAQDHGVFIYQRSVLLSSFKIAKHETTYELWEEVRAWAIQNGYSFANQGKEGFPHAGAIGWGGDTDVGTGTDSGTPAQKKTRPVTCINWRDAIVWCNAYSELSGKKPVYYTDNTFMQVLKASSSGTEPNTAADTAKIKTGADGYRLPTEAEWEYAARGGNQSTLSWNDTYAGTNTTSAPTGALKDYAWYKNNSSDMGNSDANYGANPAGKKTTNSRMLYDMSGNVWEWCWDWYGPTIQTNTPSDGVTTGSSRVLRGGSWDSVDSHCAVAYRHYENPHGERGNIGFRVVCR